MTRPATPLLAVDCVAVDAHGRVLLIRRGSEPFKNMYALPGGFVDVGETVEEACRRELEKETGVKAGDLRLVGIYSDAQRDPRGHVVGIAFMTQIAGTEAEAGDDAAAVEWLENWRGVALAFDHAKILRDALERARSKTPVTLQDLRERGMDARMEEVIGILVGEITPARARGKISLEEMWALGYGPPCPCGDRGLAPGEKDCKECDDQFVMEYGEQCQ